MKYEQLELSILSSYAEDADLFAPCENYAFEDIWQEPMHKIVFRIIQENHRNKVISDVFLIRDKLFKMGYSKEDIKGILVKFAVVDYKIKQNIKDHMEVVFDMYCRRRLKPVIHSSYNQLFSNNGDLEENVNIMKDAFNDIDSVKNNLSIERSITDLFDETYKEFEDAQNNKKEIIGYETGLNDLDRITCGLKQEIIVIGAPPGAGKSSLMINIMKNVSVESDAPLMVFSLEMPGTQLMKNLWANCLNINSWQIRSGNVMDGDVDRIKALRNKLKDNLQIDDKPGITWQYIETKIRKMRRTIPMDKVIVVMIDYLQLMNNTFEEYKGMSDERQMSLRVKGLQELHKKYNLCIIELSQLSREASKEGRRPKMSDLKDSGAIEANAVQVWLLYRPDYYEKEPKDIDGTDLRGLCEINVAKNRYGETKAVYVEFLAKYSGFKNYRPNERSQDEPF